RSGGTSFLPSTSGSPLRGAVAFGFGLGSPTVAPTVLLVDIWVDELHACLEAAQLSLGTAVSQMQRDRERFCGIRRQHVEVHLDPGEPIAELVKRDQPRAIPGADRTPRKAFLVALIDDFGCPIVRARAGRP